MAVQNKPLNKKWYDGKKILKDIEQKSAQRRVDPLKSFEEFLESIWMDNSEEEALANWKVQVEEFPWNADDYLYCLDKIIANPPANLVEIMKQKGWIILNHETAEKITPYSPEEYLDWLKQMKANFQKIYDQA